MGMKMVLEKCPEIGRNYGIVVNQVPQDLGDHLNENPLDKENFIEAMIGKLPRKCHTSNIFFMREITGLCRKNNALVHASALKSIQGKSFEKFVYTDMPTASISDCDDIEYITFAEVLALILFWIKQFYD